MLHLLQTTCTFYATPLISAAADTGVEWKVTSRSASFKRGCVSRFYTADGMGKSRTMIPPNESENATLGHLRVCTPTANSNVGVSKFAATRTLVSCCQAITREAERPHRG